LNFQIGEKIYLAMSDIFNLLYLKLYFNCSIVKLSLVHPLASLRFNAWVSAVFDEIGLVHSHLILGLKVMLMVRSSVSNYNLTGVFVWHDNTWDS